MRVHERTRGLEEVMDPNQLPSMRSGCFLGRVQDMVFRSEGQRGLVFRPEVGLLRIDPRRQDPDHRRVTVCAVDGMACSVPRRVRGAGLGAKWVSGRPVLLGRSRVVSDCIPASGGSTTISSSDDDAKFNRQRLVFGLYLLVLIAVAELVAGHFKLPAWPAFMAMIFLRRAHGTSRKRRTSWSVHLRIRASCWRHPSSARWPRLNRPSSWRRSRTSWASCTPSWAFW